jgi:hypothetical protein
MDRKQQPAPTAPFVDPRVGGNPAAAAYKAGFDARRAAAGGLPKIQDPVGGGPPPAIPRLDGPAHAGLTMEQHAHAERPQPAPRMPQGSIVEPPQHVAPQSNPRAPAVNLSPADTLHPDAQKDPAFRQGMGSMIASSQPELALKYGVYRNGKFIPPQQLATPRAQLSPQTLEGLNALQELQQRQASPPAVGRLSESERAAEDDVARGPAGAAARVGNMLGDQSNRPLSGDEREQLRNLISKMDDFDFDSFRQSMMKDILNNPEQKEIIESKLTALDLSDLVSDGYVVQDVPVVEGKLTFTFRSQTGEEDLELKRMVMVESKSLEVSDRYLLDKYAFMSLTLGIEKINGRMLGTVYDKEGNFSEEQFIAKLKKVLRLPLHLLASIGVNQMWFEQRVRKLCVAEKVGNG